ncbi:MAG TPA: glycosyltransferase family 4 protein, partial [Longimicrobium sp.]|nr:glycosyltransferase family 4 protein [Longimicrobium sp.]
RIVLSNASYQWGGVHRITEALAVGLQLRGHEVVVFGRPDSPLYDRLREVAPFEPILKGMDLHPRVVWRARSALRHYGTEVVLTLMKKDVRLTGPAAWSLGIPVVVRHANDRPLRGTPIDRLLFGRVPVMHVANSRATRETLLGAARWLRPDAVTVVHNGIDPALFAGAEPAALGLPDGALVVGFIGRFERRKGLIDLARAWPAVAEAAPEAHLVLVGKGPAEAEARALLGSVPRVHWLGYQTDIPALLRSMHLLAVPSHWEGFGLVAAEALAAGIPVVAARASSLPEIVEDGVHGLLVPPHDPPALEAALLRLARDPAERARMGAAGQALVAAEFSVERMLDRYEELLGRVVTSRE